MNPLHDRQQRHHGTEHRQIRREDRAGHDGDTCEPSEDLVEPRPDIGAE